MNLPKLFSVQGQAPTKRVEFVFTQVFAQSGQQLKILKSGILGSASDSVPEYVTSDGHHLLFEALAI